MVGDAGLYVDGVVLRRGLGQARPQPPQIEEQGFLARARAAPNNRCPHGGSNSSRYVTFVTFRRDP